jgi:sugar lactone lactonase YvrE
MGPGARRLANPVAIQYVGGARPDQGFLTIVDQARAVVQVGRDGALTPRPLQTSASWRELGALGASSDGHLYVLDSGARRLLEYPMQSQHVAEPPRILLDDSQAPGLAFERAVEIVGQPNAIYVRTDDGALRRFDTQGHEIPMQVRPPDGQPPILSGIASDRAGGLFLADPGRSRILHTAADGTLLRQLRDPALAGVRQIKSSVDGRRIYGLVTSGVLVFDVP